MVTKEDWSVPGNLHLGKFRPNYSSGLCLMLQGGLAFIAAIARVHVEMSKLLIAHGANPDFAVNNVSAQRLD